MKYYIKTFGCAQNVADSQRVATYLQEQGAKPAKTINKADYIVINTCMVRQKAEDRIYGLVGNLGKRKKKEKGLKIIVTGCLVGMALQDKSGKFMRQIRKRLPQVDQFLNINEIGFDIKPQRDDKTHAWIPISNGCNNFCSYCVVPFTRGREVSRPMEDILFECNALVKKGYSKITLLGQNVNSYGADIVKSKKKYKLPDGKIVEPVLVKHLGRLRIPTLFSFLLEEICKIKGVKKVDFISSNPWDFSDELIEVIAKNPKITRLIHLPVQSGDNQILKKMNRWYTRKQYLQLLEKIRRKMPRVLFSTDIIVGFSGESEKQFENTVDLCQKANFLKAYISLYSERPFTLASRQYKDDVSLKEKKRRWRILENLINKPNLYRKEYKQEFK